MKDNCKKVMLIAVGLEGIVRIYNIITGKLTKSLNYSRGRILQVKVFANKNGTPFALISTGYPDTNLQLIHLNSYKCLYKIK